MSTTHPLTGPATRTIGGAELPAPGRWEIDPGHAEVAFIGRHLVVSKVRGRFTGVRGTVVVDEEPEASSLEVEIDLATVDSGDATRDEHLRSADLLDVEAHPTATYRSTAVRWDGSAGTVEGEQTIHGVTRPVPLQVEHLGTVTDPWGGVRAAFSAHTTIDREDWGITWNMPLANGGLVVSKEIRIEIEVETVRTDA
ncbi:YceI family protein [Iamia sp. SCSIO 61187]|uniref:YceI family protein n=1 Tax=Iamia sp. SCSIO 61187 TaxID=2722752 RepID=UPI001C637A70|nr:YceI family protein [Iamia sp. SCSIO 61187]QYG94650.1 YceI family protein [Iamia sp. SCSIO 61187]